jgi:hypothetical protein
MIQVAEKSRLKRYDFIRNWVSKVSEMWRFRTVVSESTARGIIQQLTLSG